MLRRIHTGDIARMHRLTEGERYELAMPLYRQLQELQVVGSVDAAGIPARGRCVYEDVLNGQHPTRIAALRWVLRQRGASRLVIDACEACDVLDESDFDPEYQLTVRTF